MTSRQIYQSLEKIKGMDEIQDNAIEELAKLIQEICKYKTGIGNKDDLAKGLASITIIQEKLLYLYEDINENYWKHLSRKMGELENTVKKKGSYDDRRR